MKRSPMPRGTAQLKRSEMKPGKPMSRGSGMKPASKPMAIVGARAKRMRQGKVPPTAAEAAWMDAAQAFGCIVCFLQQGIKAPAEIHHLKSGDRRMGHLHSIGLCVAHHRGGAKDGLFISRHPEKARFETAYGTEAELLDQLRGMLEFTPWRLI